MNLSSHWLSARPDLALDRSADGWRIEGFRLHLTLEDLGEGSQLALRTLFQGGATETELAGAVTQTEGLQGLPSFYFLLKRLESEGVICRSIRNENGCLATMVPVGSRYQYRPAAPGEDGRYRLSRFAYCRRTEDGLVMESPLSQAQMVLRHRHACSLVHELARRSRTVQELSETSPEISQSVAGTFVGLAMSGGFLVQCGEDVTAENGDLPLSAWEFHDLLFHSRSRLGRHRNPFGATYRFGSDIPFPAALKPSMSDATISLDVPCLAEVSRRDPSLTAALESRRSIRTFGEVPISKAQLGEFLYRTFRIRRLIPTDHGELASRPYPSGGALYELEIYPVVDRCEGLDRGLYHYRPGDHALSCLPAGAEAVSALLEQSWLTLDREGRPQVLFVITARFARLAWKYQSVAYALTLKHVGVLYQTMYLVATAMNLAPCALGGGDSELFALASGLDYLSEGSVGEFVLGTRPT